MTRDNSTVAAHILSLQQLHSYWGTELQVSRLAGYRETDGMGRIWHLPCSKLWGRTYAKWVGLVTSYAIAGNKITLWSESRSSATGSYGARRGVKCNIKSFVDILWTVLFAQRDRKPSYSNSCLCDSFKFSYNSNSIAKTYSSVIMIIKSLIWSEWNIIIIRVILNKYNFQN